MSTSIGSGSNPYSQYSTTGTGNAGGAHKGKHHHKKPEESQAGTAPGTTPPSVTGPQLDLTA